MKTILMLVLIVFLSINLFGQTGMTINDARSGGGINMVHLDSLYKSGVNVQDSSKGAFSGHEQEYQESWYKMLKDLGEFVHKNGFMWGKPTSCFNRVYFKNDGSIDYFLYSIRDIDDTKAKEFNRLLNEFIKTYKFPMTNKVNFSQCGSSKYED